MNHSLSFMKRSHHLKIEVVKVAAFILLFFLFYGNTCRAQEKEAVSSKRDKAGLALAKKLQKKLTKGADFQTLAKKYSDDPGSARVGGELGYVDLGQLVPEYENAALALTPGAISEPVKTRFGYHLIQLIDRKEDKISTRHILITP